MLQKLDEQNLFLTSIPGEERTYRYHSLFADYLQTHLLIEKPEEVARLHLLAARWYKSRMRPVPAVDHAIEGGAYRYALSLLAPQAHGLLELERADDPTVWERLERQRLPAHEIDYFKLGRIRWDIHFGDAGATLPLLECELDKAAGQSRHFRALRLRVLQSLALQRSGEPSAAIETLAGVLRQASREGFVRLIVDEGEYVGRLVCRFYAMLEECLRNAAILS